MKVEQITLPRAIELVFGENGEGGEMKIDQTHHLGSRRIDIGDHPTLGFVCIIHDDPLNEPVIIYDGVFFGAPV